MRQWLRKWRYEYIGRATVVENRIAHSYVLSVNGFGRRKAKYCNSDMMHWYLARETVLHGEVCAWENGGPLPACTEKAA